jgi:muramoyltetrapeptide carboxypeptidase LdcA involved in peptidoglycan recycling
MLLPKSLNRGGTIGVIAPSSPILTAGEKAIERGYTYLRGKGLAVVEGKFCRIQASPQERAGEINNFFGRRDIDCLMAFWGGHTASEVLGYLDYDLIRKNPKIIIGYSDITTITSAITVRTGLVTFSGPGIISFAKPQPFEYTWESFRRECIAGEDNTTIKPSDIFADDAYYLRPDNDHRIIQLNRGLCKLHGGSAHGAVIAGHLHSLVALFENGYEIPFSDSVLFVEFSEEETAESVGATLKECRDLDIWRKVRGIVVGRFVARDMEERVCYEDVIKNEFADLNLPILYNADFGHSDPMFTIPNGGVCTIDADKKIILFSRAVE